MLLSALVFGLPSIFSPTPTNASRPVTPPPRTKHTHFVTTADLEALQNQIDMLRRLVLDLAERDVTPVNIEAKTITFFHRGKDTLHIEVEEENRGPVQIRNKPAVAKRDNKGKPETPK